MRKGIHAFSQIINEAVVNVFRGYWLECVMAERFSPAARMQVPKMGFHVKDFDKYYARNKNISSEHQLFLAWVDRTTLEAGTAAYNGTTIRRSQLDLTLVQKALLEFLYQGATKRILAQHYNTTEQAIRARLSVIYKKIHQAPPNLLKDGTEWADLSAYLKNHYEEFRPYAGLNQHFDR